MKILQTFQKHPASHDAFFFVTTLLAAFLHIASWVLLFSSSLDKDASIILHYTAGRGVNFFAPSIRLFFIPAFAAAVFVLNVVLAMAFYSRERLVSYFLVSTAALVQIFSLIAIWALLAVNI